MEIRIKTILMTLLAFMAILPMNATERFVFFESKTGALSLKGATIGYSDQESKAVQIAAANLQQDIASVMGFTPVLSPLTSHSSPLILIGTVGCNKQIDQWVKQKVLKNLKGKRCHPGTGGWMCPSNTVMRLSSCPVAILTKNLL